jgi:hypothetical protein
MISTNSSARSLGLSPNDVPSTELAESQAFTDPFTQSSTTFKRLCEHTVLKHCAMLHGAACRVSPVVIGLSSRIVGGTVR